MAYDSSMIRCRPFLNSRERMRQQAGVGKLKNAPPLQDAVQPVLPDGAGAGWETVPAFEQVELHVITTKTQTPRVLFRSFGRVELVVTARDVQHGGTYAAGVRIVPIAGHRAAEGGHAADGIRVSPGKAIVERHGLGETKQHAPSRRDCQFA